MPECQALKTTATRDDPACHNTVDSEGDRCHFHRGQPRWDYVPAGHYEAVIRANEALVDEAPDLEASAPTATSRRERYPLTSELSSSAQLRQLYVRLGNACAALEEESDPNVVRLRERLAEIGDESGSEAWGQGSEERLDLSVGKIVAALADAGEVGSTESPASPHVANARFAVRLVLEQFDVNWPFIPDNVRRSSTSISAGPLSAEVVEGRSGVWQAFGSVNGERAHCGNYCDPLLALIVGWHGAQRFARGIDDVAAGLK